MSVNTGPAAQYPVKQAIEVLPIVISAEIVVFADLETTGFGKYSDIIEIGAVKVNVSTGKVLDAFSTLCHLKIQRKVPAKVTEITHITTKMLEDAPKVEKVLLAFRKFIGASPLSFHNAPFDWTMLRQKYETLGICLTNEVICTRKLFHFLHPEEPCNLEHMTSYYGKPIEGHHRAYIDCKWTAACYRNMRHEILDRYSKGLLPVEHELPPQSGVRKVREVALDELLACCHIYRIVGWKKGPVSRIYCITDVADFFYDLNEHVWSVAKNKTALNLNTDVLARFILKKLGLDLAEFQTKYQACKGVQNNGSSSANN